MSEPPLRIAVYGTGGVGAHFGGRLALGGEEVAFVARGEHLRAIRAGGLRLELPDGERTIHPLATDDPADIGPVDVVLLAVKTWQVRDCARAMAPLLASGSFVVPLQNGVEAAGELASELGEERVVGGLCGTISFVVAPGRVRTVGASNFVRFGERGERSGERSARCARLLAAFERAGVRAEIPPDIEVALWEKFLFVVPVGGVGATTRAPIGVFRSLPETRELLERAMREVEALSRARGVALDAGIVPKSLHFVDKLTPEGTSSLQRDLAAGRPSELEAWVGAVARLGRESGVATPVNDFFYRCLLPLELRARGRLSFPGDPPA
jgi:2-dehydropantoate 2-reductase